MQHKMADLLMKDVEAHYRGDFLINGDLTLSHQISAMLRKKEQNRFYGNNGLFLPTRMFATEVCEKTSDCIIVPQGGIIYGPYFTFPAGEYTAQFCIQHVENVSLLVSCNSRGVISSLEVLSPKDDVLSVSFSLPELTEQVEFKVINNASLPILFKSVEIASVNLHITDDSMRDEPLLEISEDLLDVFRDISELKHRCERQKKDLTRMADCDLPEHTRLRRLKLLFRRLMRPFTLMQVSFNHAVLAFLYNIQEEIAILITMLVNYNQQHTLESFDSNVVSSDPRIAQLQQQNALLSERLDAISSSLLNVQEMLCSKTTMQDMTSSEHGSIQREPDLTGMQK